jgi:hypothetical protein
MTGNKKIEIQRKSAHLDGLKAAKNRRSVEPIFERPSPTREEKQTILIVCEGENTEPTYFNQFRLTSATIKAIGKGYNTVSLVQQATNLQAKYKCDHVWCVFDKDSNSPQNFNGAISLANSLNYGIAWSNQAFEYWLILHLEDHQGGGMNRSEYNDKINKYINPLGAVYDGESNKKISDKFFNLLIGIDPKTNTNRTNLAISRARRNLSFHSGVNLAAAESSTTVFQLVEEILKYV